MLNAFLSRSSLSIPPLFTGSFYSGILVHKSSNYCLHILYLMLLKRTQILKNSNHMSFNLTGNNTHSADLPRYYMHHPFDPVGQYKCNSCLKLKSLHRKSSSWASGECICMLSLSRSSRGLLVFIFQASAHHQIRVSTPLLRQLFGRFPQLPSNLFWFLPSNPTSQSTEVASEHPDLETDLNCRLEIES